MESFFQTASSFQYLQLLVPVGIERCELHGVVASVSRAPHQLQHQVMRATRVVAFRSLFVAQIRDSDFWIFVPFTFDRKLKKLAPQIRTDLCSEQKRDVLWSQP